MRKALNRERTNVGRTAYGNRIKAIANGLQVRAGRRSPRQDLEGLCSGTARDELKNWSDVGAPHAKSSMQRGPGQIVFATAEHL